MEIPLMKRQLNWKAYRQGLVQRQKTLISTEFERCWLDNFEVAEWVIQPNYDEASRFAPIIPMVNPGDLYFGESKQQRRRGFFLSP
jgi:hypothetical protein